MSFMIWSDELSVKVDAMDNQHKKIVDMINLLHDAMKEGHGSEKIGPILESLITYTKEHFDDEEKMMKAMGFAGYNAHVKLHQSLVKQVGDLYTKFKVGEPLSTFQVLNFLREWLVNHIQKEDVKYSKYVVSNSSIAASSN